MIPSFQLVEMFPFNLLYVEMISEDQTSICTCTANMFVRDQIYPYVHHDELKTRAGFDSPPGSWAIGLAPQFFPQPMAHAVLWLRRVVSTKSRLLHSHVVCVRDDCSAEARD